MKNMEWYCLLCKPILVHLSATELKALDELHGQEYGVVNGDHSRPMALAALHQFQDSGGCPEMRVRR